MKKNQKEIYFVFCLCGLLFSICLFIPFMQKIILSLGEFLIQRSLAHSVWINRFIKLGDYGIITYLVCLMIGIYIFFDKTVFQKHYFFIILFSGFLYLCVTIIIYHIDIRNVVNKRILITLIFGAFLFLLFPKVKYGELTLVFLVAILSVTIVFCVVNLSPIDECVNFDFILHIIKYHKLPNFGPVDFDSINESIGLQERPGLGGCNYESVQGPVYYIIMAFLTYFMPSRIRFYFIRLFGAFMAFVSYYFVRKIFIYLHKSRYIQDLDLAKQIVFFITLSPGVLFRCATIGNECMVIFLASLLSYLVVKMLLTEYCFKQTIICTIISALIFLTKNTGAYWFGAVLIVLIYYRKIKDVFINFFVFIICVTPWFLHNYLEYGALTGMSKHVDFVVPIVNLGRVRMTIGQIFQSIFCLFESAYLLPQDVGYSNVILHKLETTFSVVLIITIFVSIFKGGDFFIKSIINKLKFNYEETERYNIVLFTCIALIFVSISMFVYAGHKTLIYAFIGRYFYMLGFPISLLLLNLISSVKVSCKMTVVFTMGFLISGLHLVELTYVLQCRGFF